MKSFFVSIYELFISLFGNDLADHLFGLNPDNSGNTDATSKYVTVGWLMLGISLAVSAVYYFWVNSPKYNRWFHWLGFMALNAVINLFVGFYLPYQDYNAGTIADEIKPGIGMNELWGFGFANALVSLVFFFVFSMILQNWSRNCSNVPFSLVGLFSRKSKKIEA